MSIGLNINFSMNLKMALKGNIIILNTVTTIFFIIDIIFTTVFTIKLLSVSMYNNSPRPNPKNIKNLKLPSEKLYIQ